MYIQKTLNKSHNHEALPLVTISTSKKFWEQKELKHITLLQVPIVFSFWHSLILFKFYILRTLKSESSTAIENIF